MGTELYRKKNMDKVSAPEQLNDYIKATSPGVWLFLAAVIILLIGVCVWGIFGRLDTTLPVAAVCENGRLTCYVKDSDISAVKTGMEISANGREMEVIAISQKPFAVDETMDAYTLYIGGLNTGDWVYEVTAAASLEDGIYDAVIIIDSVTPISFIFN